MWVCVCVRAESAAKCGHVSCALLSNVCAAMCARVWWTVVSAHVCAAVSAAFMCDTVRLASTERPSYALGLPSLSVNHHSCERDRELAIHAGRSGECVRPFRSFACVQRGMCLQHNMCVQRGVCLLWVRSLSSASVRAVLRSFVMHALHRHGVNLSIPCWRHLCLHLGRAHYVHAQYVQT